MACMKKPPDGGFFMAGNTIPAWFQLNVNVSAVPLMAL